MYPRIFIRNYHRAPSWLTGFGYILTTWLGGLSLYKEREASSVPVGEGASGDVLPDVSDSKGASC